MAISGLPIEIRGEMITQSSVVFPGQGEDPLVETVYTIGQTVTRLVGDLYHKFECKSESVMVDFSNIETMPQAYPDDETNEHWIDLGAANKFAPFHLQRNSLNTATSPYTVTFDPKGRVGAIGINGVEADSVTLEVYSKDSDLVYQEIKKVVKRNVYNFWTWVYAKPRQQKKLLFDNLPMAHGNLFKLTFFKSKGSVRVGSIIPVLPVNIGFAQYNADIRRDVSNRVDRGDFFNIKVNQRPVIPKRSLNLVIEKKEIDGVLEFIDDLGGQVTIWAGTVENAGNSGYFESLLAVGFARNFRHTIKHPSQVEALLEIEEL